MLIPTDKGKDREGVQAHPFRYHSRRVRERSPEHPRQLPGSPRIRKGGAGSQREGQRGGEELVAGCEEQRDTLRAYPGILDLWRGICSKSPEHDTDHGEADECSDSRCVAFEVASQTTVTTDPRERSFDDPPFG